MTVRHKIRLVVLVRSIGGLVRRKTSLTVDLILPELKILHDLRNLILRDSIQSDSGCSWASG